MGLNSHFLSLGRERKRYFVVQLFGELNYVPEDAGRFRYPTAVRFFKHWRALGASCNLVPVNALRMEAPLSFVFAGRRGRRAQRLWVSFGGQRAHFDLIEVIVRNREGLVRGPVQEVLNLRTAQGSVCRLSVRVRECGFREAERVKYGRQAPWGRWAEDDGL